MDSYDAFRDYEHRVGRWWMLTGFALLLAVPAAICVRLRRLAAHHLGAPAACSASRPSTGPSAPLRC